MKACVAIWGLVFLCLATGAKAAPVPVYVQNKSAAVTSAELVDAMPAFQAAVSEDFAPVWGTDCKLILGYPPKGAMRIVLTDNVDVWGALGYHWVFTGAPTSKVFPQMSEDNGVSWQLVFTHELFEMLADPWVNRASLSKRTALMPPRWWLVEVADPVEDTAFTYTKPGISGTPVEISDFITPAWYGGAPPYDFTGHVIRPLQILDGGYANYWMNGRWNNITVGASKWGD